MIYDLDAGRPERPARAGGARMTILTIGAGLVTLAFFSALASPGDRESQTPLLRFSAPYVEPPRPVFVTRPVPDKVLTLPEDVATVTYRITYQGQTGLVNRADVATTYRLRASNDLVVVAPLPPAEALPYPSPAAGDAPLRVRGRDANWVITPNGTTAIRWTESGVVFEMSSRTLSLAQLADLANRLR